MAPATGTVLLIFALVVAAGRLLIDVFMTELERIVPPAGDAQRGTWWD